MHAEMPYFFIFFFPGEVEAKDAGVPEEEIWLGLPRAGSRDTAQMRVTPGAGEWSLYPWGGHDAFGWIFGCFLKW